MTDELVNDLMQQIQDLSGENASSQSHMVQLTKKVQELTSQLDESKEHVKKLQLENSQLKKDNKGYRQLLEGQQESGTG